jgi:DNA repair protein RecO (recombination protein O)
VTSATYSAQSIVLRTVRYGDDDGVIALQTLERGRVSAFAKGIRKPSSKLRGRLQPGTVVQLELAPGKGDLHSIRGAQVIDANAGLWVEGYRLQAASSILEATLRIAPEEETNPGPFHLLTRGLSLLAVTSPRSSPARLDPIVLGVHLKLILSAGLLPQLGACVVCGRVDQLVGFSARLGGVLCDDCAERGEPIGGETVQALGQMVGRPLGEADATCPPEAAAGVERVIGIILQEHLGVTLRSATPI